MRVSNPSTHKNLKDLVFGELLVIKDSGRRDSCRQILWECKCSCGNTVYVPTRSLTGKRTKSCGCLSIDRCRKGLNTKHNLCNSRLYKIWVNMKSRCYNPNTPDYQNYGGRGIRICEEWLSDFSNFYSWSVLNGYSEDLTIDRIDNEGDYCPENCRWATRPLQANNKRNNTLIEYNGESHTISEWSSITGISYNTLIKRLMYLKWSVSKAFETPVKKYNFCKGGIINA